MGARVSDTAQGPDWWQASDGKWYPPELRQTGPAAEPQPAYGPSMGPSSGPPFGPSRESDAKGFIAALYDFKFDHFVTPKVIRFLYAFFVVILSLGAIVFLIASLATGRPAAIVFAIIAVPIIYLVYVILARIYMELVATLFRISDDLRAIRRDKGI